MKPVTPVGMERSAPEEIKSIDKNGVRYSNTPKERDFVVATELKKGVAGKVLWKAQVLNYWKDPKAPADLETYFHSMVLTNGDSKLLIVDENQVRYSLDLKTRKVSVLDWLVGLQPVAFSPTDKGWSYQVKLTIHNSLGRVMKLDEDSVAYGGKPGAPGQLSNNLFKVTVDGKEVPYQGMMKDRVPPDSFIELKPGASYAVVVELGDEYPIPKGPHDVVVEFEHTNHFSPDDFRMKSEPKSFHLEGSWKLKEKPKP